MNLILAAREGTAQGDRGRRKHLRDLLRDNPDVDPYPEGWFVIEFSEKVRSDRLISKKFVGEDVILFRDPRTSQVIVAQAYCPHFGAHFDAYGTGGCLNGGVITCPYHHTKFDPGAQQDAANRTGLRHLKTYPTFEAHGFVLALRQRDPSAPQLPKPDLSFAVDDESEFLFGTETFGVFHGDSLVPLLANADFRHFQTVHMFPQAVSDQNFRVAADGRSSHWSFEIRERYSHESDLLPSMGGNWLKFRTRKWRREIVGPGQTPKTHVIVKSSGVGAGLAKSDWWQPAFGLHLLSLLYVTPIDPFTYEIFANCGVKTFKKLRPKPVQKAVNYLAMRFHLWANTYLAKYDDLPFYNLGKIRLDRPAYTEQDRLLKSYVSWWKQHGFSDAYLRMIDGYDLDFT